MMNLSKILILPVFALFLAGCQPPDSNKPAETAATNSQTFQVSGVASKGPIQSATVEIFALDSNGQAQGTALSSTTTDVNGQWQVSFTSAPTEASLIVVTGGQYIDESDPASDKRTIDMAGNSLQGILFAGYNTASVTLLTHALLEKSRRETTSANFQAVINNNRNTAAQALGFDPFTTAAANPLAPSNSASDDAIEYAMLLGGMATALNSAAIMMGQPVADYNMMTGFINDLSDGVLDGKQFGTTIQLTINGSAVDFPTTLDLNQSIQRFRNNNFAAYAKTNVQQNIEIDQTILSLPGTNVSPSAQDDTAATISNVAVNLSGLLQNDSDADGDQLVISTFTQPVDGSVAQQADGTLTFTPAQDFTGNTVFNYTVTDNRGGSASAQVIITVAAAPGSGGSTGIDPTANAGNDQDVDEQVTVTLDGSASLDADGSISSYQWTQVSGTTVTMNNADTVQASFTAPATSDLLSLVFTLTVTDNDGQTDDDSVNVIVHPVNVAPVADAGTNQPSANEESTITLDGSNSSDSDGTIESYNWTQVDGVAVTLSNADQATASFTSPTVLAGGLETLFFQLTVTDNGGDSSSDFISVTVNPVLNAPVANAGADQTVTESDGTTPVVVTLDGSASSDDRSITSYNWTQIGGSPVLALSDPGAVNPTFTAPDVANDTTYTFQLTVTDDEGATNTNSDTNTVDITILSRNVAPQPADDAVTTDEDTALQITTLLDNDSDAEGDAFTINSVIQGSNGSVVIDAGNLSVTYTPNANFNGSDSFSYTLIDEFGAISSGSATVNVTVNGVNDNPVAVTDSGSVVQGFPVTLSDLTANDTDLENDTLSITGISQPSNGVTVNNGDGTITYTPNLTFNGSDSFTYNIVDGNGGSATGTVNITVIADSDGDGVIDTDETIDGTDPNQADSDGDGFDDRHEKIVGTNPNLNTDFPPTTVISSANGNNTINVDTTWSLANAPYWLQDDVNIQSGATLTIEPGVVIKSSASVDIFVDAGGILNAVGNAPVPQHVVFTSVLDDSINGDTNGDGVATTASSSDWSNLQFNSGSTGTLSYANVRNGYSCLAVNNSSPQFSNLEIGDCGLYGIEFQSTSGTNTLNLKSIKLTDIDGNGQSTAYSGVYIYSASNAIAVVNIDDLQVLSAGSNNSRHSFYVYANGGHVNGSINALTINNAKGDGLNILNLSSGNIDLALSNLSIDGSAGNALDVKRSSTGALALTIDGINAFTNSALSNSALLFENVDPDFLSSGTTSIDSAGYGMKVINSQGNFNNITINNISIAGLVLENQSAPQTFNNVVLTNAPTPYELNGQDITAIIGAGYDYSDASANKTHIRLGGTLLNSMTLSADPLSSGNSVWNIITSVTVPSAATLTINDGAIVKFGLSTNLFVNGSLKIGDGDGTGSKAVLTSIRDDAVGAAIGDGNAADKSDWYYIQVGDNSVIDIDNAEIRYASRAIYLNSTNPATLSLTNSTISDMYTHGLEIYGSTGDTITLNLNNVNFDRVGISTSYHGMYFNLINGATLDGNWFNVTMNDIGGSGILIIDNSTGTVNPVISGLTIGDTGTIGQNGVDIQGDATTTPTFDNSSGSANLISGGIYNFHLQGVGGNYSQLTLSNASAAAIFIEDAVNPLGGWDDASIIINNTPAPYFLRADLPTTIGTLATSDLGYNTSSSSLTQNTIATGGDLSDLRLVADPLNTSDSLYSVTASATVLPASTLTIDDGAIVKFSLSTNLFVNGSLKIGDGDGIGSKAVLTSIRDDAVGAAIGDGNAADKSDWYYIQVGDNSVIDIDNAEIRYASRAIYLNGTNPATLSLTNSTISDMYTHGLEIYGNTGDTITLNLNNVNFDRVGISTSYHGMYFNLINDATLDGNWFNVTMNDIGGSGILIIDNSTGTVNPVISGLTIGDTGTIGQNGVDIQGDATTTPTFDNSTGNVNLIAGGAYNLRLQGVGGSYNNMTLNNATNAAVYFSENAAPSTWANITIGNAPSPYEVAVMNIPTGVSYTPGSGLVEDYVRLSGTTTSDLTLDPDPLGSATGTGQATDPTVSYWYVPSTLQVAASTTLTINADTLMKFDETTYLQVNSGGVLAINGSAGNEVYLTSYSDDVVGDPSVSVAQANDWYGIWLRDGSTSSSLSNLSIWYANWGISIDDVTTDPLITSAQISNGNIGVYINGSTTIAPAFNNLSIIDNARQGIYLTGNSAMAPVFSGTLQIRSNQTNYDNIYTNSTSGNIKVEGWLIEGGQSGIQINGPGIYRNNLIRGADQAGININTSSSLQLYNNTIVNNGDVSNFGGGIRIQDIGASSIIEKNLIRHNESYNGGGIGVQNGSPIIRNNLIVENYANRVGGVYLNSSSAVLLQGNTIADNTATSINGSTGVGIRVDTASTDVTITDNIVVNNRDTSGTLHNYEDLAGVVVEDYNLSDDALLNAGVNDLSSISAQFSTTGWYLGGASPAINAGSDTALNLSLDSLTTQVDGTFDSGTADMGYHYPAAAALVDAAQSTVTPANATIGYNTQQTIVITTRDVSGNLLPAGQHVSISGTIPSGASLSSVVDQGDGSYQAIFTSGTVDASVTLSVTVNGVLLNDQVVISWP